MQVTALLDEHRLDVMFVVGGYNSSNTCNLARICADSGNACGPFISSTRPVWCRRTRCVIAR